VKDNKAETFISALKEISQLDDFPMLIEFAVEIGIAACYEVCRNEESVDIWVETRKQNAKEAIKERRRQSMLK
jgi:hypothetical protein